MNVNMAYESYDKEIKAKSDFSGHPAYGIV